MNLTNLTTALFLVTTACGVVVEPSEDTAPTPAGPALEEPPVGIFDDEAAPAESPLLIEAPRAAATSGSLFKMTFDNGAPIIDIISATEIRRIDIVEQKIVTVTDKEVQLVLELAPPTGSFTRTLVTDATRNGGTYTDQVLCEYNGYATFDARCETTSPAAREMPSTGTLTAAQWKLTVIDDNGVPLSSCVSPGANKLSCVLPGKASASYRIIASAHGFADLWDGSANFGPFVRDGVPFFGSFAAQSDWQCWDWRVSGSSMWCAARYEFVRFTAIDRARLDFDPITVRITANGSATAMATPALSWDPGNDDVPGSTY